MAPDDPKQGRQLYATSHHLMERAEGVATRSLAIWLRREFQLETAVNCVPVVLQYTKFVITHSVMCRIAT